jgi:regulator of sirC expression with transglutaminase-like and TPR domain
LTQLTKEPAGAAALRARAQELERQAAKLRSLADQVHQRRVQAELTALFTKPEAEIDLLRAALLVARLDNEDVDVATYVREVERMAREVAATFPKDPDDQAKVRALNKYLFEERGFHGSRMQYYHRSNSYLTEVMDDREGLPITLSVLYLELARRVGVAAVGVGLPGHFVVEVRPAKGEPQLFDVFEAKPLSRAEAEALVTAATGAATPAHFLPLPKKAILQRMLTNLLNVATRERDAAAMLGYLDTLLALDPNAARERSVRMVVRLQQGDRDGARTDADWLLDKQPAGIDLERVKAFRRTLDR